MDGNGRSLVRHVNNQDGSRYFETNTLQTKRLYGTRKYRLSNGLSKICRQPVVSGRLGPICRFLQIFADFRKDLFINFTRFYFVYRGHITQSRPRDGKLMHRGEEFSQYCLFTGGSNHEMFSMTNSREILPVLSILSSPFPHFMVCILPSSVQQ